MILGWLWRLVSGVNNYFSADLFGLSVYDLTAKKCNSQRNQMPSQISDLQNESAEEGAGEKASEESVFNAIRESEQNLLIAMEESPELFQFIEATQNDITYSTKSTTSMRPYSLSRQASSKGSASHSELLLAKDKHHKTRETSHVVSSPQSGTSRIPGLSRNASAELISNSSNRNGDMAGPSSTDAVECHERVKCVVPQASTSWIIDAAEFETANTEKARVSANTSRLPTLNKNRSQATSSGKVNGECHRNVNRDLVPQNTAEPHLMAGRKVFDLHRWYCISRPQYKTSCGLSSVVSCWNYLFSTLGRGSCLPITQEEALVALGFQPDFSAIRFGPITGNVTLMRWFNALNARFNTKGRCYFLYKPNGRNKTLGVSAEKALSRLKDGLRRPDKAFIYHCLNHYFCPIGYEDEPTKATGAYSTSLSIEERDTWFLIGDTSRNQPCIHSIRWEAISRDLNSKNPDYVDIRRLWKGVQQRTKNDGGNIHCIMAFERYDGAKQLGEQDLESDDEQESLDEAD